jgi:Protein of unknown function (DUF1573)
MCLCGCYHRVTSAPGETFSAGYIFADKHPRVGHDFVVRNTTSEPVTIHHVEKSCTCTSFKLGKYQLAPGEATTLTIHVDLTPTYMQKFATCVLKTNHPRLKDWAYNIQFISLPFVVADPSDLNLGSFTVDGQNLNAVQHATLDLFAESNIELTRDNFSVPDELELSILSGPEVRRLQRDVWKTRYQVAIGLSSKGCEAVLHDSRTGLITKTVQLSAGESRSRQWHFSVYWQAVPPLVSHPEYLSFGNLLDEMDNHWRSVVISSTTRDKFRIVSAKNQSRDVRIEFSVDSPGDAPRHCVKFRVPQQDDAQGQSADGTRRFLSGTVHVQTTGKPLPAVEIPWSAMLDPSVKLRPSADQPKTSPAPGL